MERLIAEQPLLLLFLVSGIGFILGRLRYQGASLGVAAVLFVGLAFGAFSPDWRLPEIVSQLGLVLFVYTVGLTSGPGFFASWRKQGLRNNAFVVSVLTFAMVLTYGLAQLAGWLPARAAGMFAGALTNTPALAGLLDLLKASHQTAALNDPVIGYSLAYPLGVLGPLLAILLSRRFFRRDEAAEARALRDYAKVEEGLFNRTIRVTNPNAVDHALHELAQSAGCEVVFGRMKRNGKLQVATEETILDFGDQVSVIGGRAALDRFTEVLGEASLEALELDRSEIDYRRICVSNPRVAGHRLRDLNLPQQFGAVVTRIRRGDIELLPHGDSVLELGDRLRVVTNRDQLEAVTKFFGDSYRSLSEIDYLTFSLGLALGLLAGLIPLPIPGGVVLRLGLAGGPLLTAMVLGSLGRSGPFVWHLPLNANLTLRQTGLILFLAGVGTRSGYAFVHSVLEPSGQLLFLGGLAVTMTTALLFLAIGQFVFKLPHSLLIGMLAGLQTQPAVLGFAVDQTGNEVPNIGYAAVFPTATIAKILLAQILLTWLQRG